MREAGLLGCAYPFAASTAGFTTSAEGAIASAPRSTTRVHRHVMSGLPGAGKDHWLARMPTGLP